MQPTDLKKEIAEWIKWIRRVRGDLTQDELSEKIRINKQQISRYERGLSMPRQKTIDKITEYGGIPLNLFIAEQKALYRVHTAEEKELFENIREILESGNEGMVDLFKANISSFLKTVRISQKNNENKEGE